MIPANFHAYAKDKNVGFIENSVKFVKERVTSVCHAAPYKKFTRLMKRSLIEGVINILIFFLQKMEYQKIWHPL